MCLVLPCFVTYTTRSDIIFFRIPNILRMLFIDVQFFLSTSLRRTALDRRVCVVFCVCSYITMWQLKVDFLCVCMSNFSCPSSCSCFCASCKHVFASFFQSHFSSDCRPAFSESLLSINSQLRLTFGRKLSSSSCPSLSSSKCTVVDSFIVRFEL